MWHIAPKLPHQSLDGIVAPLHCSISIQNHRLLHDASLSKLYLESKSCKLSSSRNITMSLSWYTLASDSQSGVSQSLWGYPLSPWSQAPSYLEEPHSQTVPDGCSMYEYLERTGAQQLKVMVNRSEVIAWSTFCLNTLNEETFVLSGWIWVWKSDKRHLEMGLGIKLCDVTLCKEPSNKETNKQGPFWSWSLKSLFKEESA